MAAAVTGSKILIMGTPELHKLYIDAIARGAFVITAPQIQFVESEPIPAAELHRYIDRRADKVILGSQS